MRSNRGGRKKFNKKKPMFAAKKKDAQQDKQIVQIGKRIKELEGAPELKCQDDEFTISAVFAPGVAQTFYLSGIDSGTEQFQRIGNKVNLKSLILRICITSHSSATDPSMTRIIIYRTQSPNGALTSSSRILSIGTAPLGPVYSNYNLDEVDGKRIKILYDRVFTQIPQVPYQWTNAPPAVSLVGGVLPLCTNPIIRLKLNCKGGYSNITDDIADSSLNSIQMLVVGNHTLGSGVYSIVRCTSQLRFTDE